MRVPLVIVAVWFVAWAPSPALAQNWTQFRGPNANGLALEAKLPAQWGADQQLAWKVKLPGVGWAQPVVWGNQIFVTTAEADKQGRPRKGDWNPSPGSNPFVKLLGRPGKPPDVPHRWKVLCLDAATGKVVWEQVARTGKPTFPIHPNCSYASETPVTDGERLMAYFGMTGIYCYDLSGKLLWSKDLGTYPMQMDWGTGSSPVLFEDRVFVQCDNDQASFLVALDKKTGQEAWRVRRDERSNWSTPYVWKNQQRTELVAAGGTKMRSYDPATGQLLWEMAASGRTATTPVGDDELLYVDSYDRLTGRQGLLAAVRAGASGDISLKPGATSNAAVAWSVLLKGTRVASPLLYGGCLYLCEQQLGIVRCLDARTGKEHYRQRLPRARGFTASPWASDGNVFCLDDHGLTVVLRAGPMFEVLATNQLDEMFWASPAVVGEKLLLRGVDHLYCIRK
ncbi:MAG: PQQ-binding-like beta-propeller repeat protein [Gemmataceae bacterium]|nr:PQQ-binding-like beta-propeller repeat protein [Gemmataceae bacterium]